jgi:hypothetical protein
MQQVTLLTTTNTTGSHLARLHEPRLHRAPPYTCNRAWLSAASDCSQSQQLLPSLPLPYPYVLPASYSIAQPLGMHHALPMLPMH